MIKYIFLLSCDIVNKYGLLSIFNLYSFFNKIFSTLSNSGVIKLIGAGTSINILLLNINYNLFIN